MLIISLYCLSIILLMISSALVYLIVTLNKDIENLKRLINNQLKNK